MYFYSILTSTFLKYSGLFCKTDTNEISHLTKKKPPQRKQPYISKTNKHLFLKHLKSGSIFNTEFTNAYLDIYTSHYHNKQPLHRY